jgi:hypothetical protein
MSASSAFRKPTIAARKRSLAAASRAFLACSASSSIGAVLRDLRPRPNHTDILPNTGNGAPFSRSGNAFAQFPRCPHGPPISDAWFHRVKGATRDLVVRCGGVVRAGEIAATSKSEVSRWQSTGADDIISVPAALALEAECGAPIVTAAMADLHGRRLSDDPIVGEAASCLVRDHAAVMRHAGELTASFAEAISDGTVTAVEADRADRIARDLDEVLDRFRRNLAATRAGATVVSINRGGH